VPGYWAWDPEFQDYYWVPGTWVLAPQPGFLWTPAWWGWGDGGYRFHEGYWGREVGFYGGINYGYGYFGHGFAGGRWDHDRFFYNRAVVNINEVNIHNVYIDKTVIINNVTVNRVSYNGGEGGIRERPTQREEAAEHAEHLAPEAVQRQHLETARTNPQMRATANQGKPPVAATARPAKFNEGAMPAREAGAPYHPPANRPAPGDRTMSPGGNPNGPLATSIPGHARELQPHAPVAAPEISDPRAAQKYQQQQQKLIDKQNQEHQKLQQQQEREDQQAAQKKWNQEKQQQVEQRHQQQTQQLEQRHQQQQQQLQTKQKPQPPR